MSAPADDPAPLNAIGWRCASCGAEVPIEAALPWRCPRATPADRRHVLHIVRRMAPLRPVHDPNPFIAFDAELAWAAFAEAHGIDQFARATLVGELDGAVAAVAGTGFRRTPMHRAAQLSDALGFSASGGIWVKDETGAVGGSHKARHLMPVLLHLRAAETLGLVPWHATSERRPLAISSCGNAALAAAVLARAADWPLRVFVPPWAEPSVRSGLADLGADVTECPRRDDDPPGDPCLHQFHDAVDAGAVPFGVQGPENALSLDGGRTLGWEVVEHLGHAIDRIVVQVGGGALAASVGAACAAAGVHPRLHAVQAAGCAPFARAWDELGPEHDLTAGAARWADVMTPWEDPHSAAEGILDDETYDWLGVAAALAGSGGTPVVAPEALIVEAHRLARAHTTIPVSATGSAGLAGVIAERDRIGDDERIVVVFSGVERAGVASVTP